MTATERFRQQARGGSGEGRLRRPSARRAPRRGNRGTVPGLPRYPGKIGITSLIATGPGGGGPPATGLFPLAAAFVVGVARTPATTRSCGPPGAELILG